MTTTGTAATPQLVQDSDALYQADKAARAKPVDENTFGKTFSHHMAFLCRVDRAVISDITVPLTKTRAIIVQVPPASSRCRFSCWAAKRA